MNRENLKTQAKSLLSGNWQWAVIFSLLTAIITGVISALTGGIGMIVGGLIFAGYAYTFLDFTAGQRENNYFTAMFAAFTSIRFIPVFLTWLLQTIFTFLWSLLLVIPGIIKALAYSQAFYIAKDLLDSGQEVAATEAITKSRELMDGHKWEFFVLQLSFLGWALLCIFTFGIGFLWLRPYMQTTNALYYRQLAGNRFRGKPVATDVNLTNEPEMI
ncbi:DUF975 family protein [Limosilactobacillus caecicola]|uniref:DUF975 family protein n=1 Tax=Limosilactobacillus caecicola TaxID=2941332 RepID=UPI00203F8884|nr:DUF975 family protein [Limosilactobacillus caecicola]